LLDALPDDYRIEADDKGASFAHVLAQNTGRILSYLLRVKTFC